MPTSPIMILPKSSSDEEFERICRDVLKSKYNMDFVLYGRRGQKQHGIDLYAESTNRSFIVVQCKNYNKKSTKKFCSQLCDDIKATDNLEFKIEKFIVMTALDRDAKIQKFICNYSAPFFVDVLFWDDIQNELCNNKKLLKAYYPNFVGDNTEIPMQDRNHIIKNAEAIIEGVKDIANNCLSYSPGRNESEDCNIYNICVDIYNAVLSLQEQRKQYYLQLEKIKVAELIKNLKLNLPEFYDEARDGTGSSMIYTIGNYKKYFSNSKNNEEYIRWCAEIMKSINNL